MKKRAFSLPSALLVATLTFVAAAVVLAPAARAETCLWRVKGEKNTVYLLGSVHLLRPQDHPLPQAMEKAYEDSAVVVLEAVQQDLNSPETMMLTMKLGMYQDGKTLEGSLKPETYAMLKERADAAGIPLAMLQSYRPWMAGMMLVMQKITSAGFDPTQGVDRHFENKARADGKDVEALETAKFQIEMFAGLSETMGDEFIKQMLAESDTMMTMLDAMVVAWKNGNIAEVEKLMMESFKASPEVVAPLLTDRNATWVEKLKNDYLKRDANVLLIGGAGHMVGEKSVVDLLCKEGFTVEQL